MRASGIHLWPLAILSLKSFRSGFAHTQTGTQTQPEAADSLESQTSNSIAQSLAQSYVRFEVAASLQRLGR